MPMGWREFAGDVGRIVGLDHFGASAACTVLYERSGTEREAGRVVSAGITTTWPVGTSVHWPVPARLDRRRPRDVSHGRYDHTQLRSIQCSGGSATADKGRFRRRGTG